MTPGSQVVGPAAVVPAEAHRQGLQLLQENLKLTRGLLRPELRSLCDGTKLLNVLPCLGQSLIGNRPELLRGCASPIAATFQGRTKLL